MSPRTSPAPQGPEAPIRVGVAGSDSTAIGLAVHCARRQCDVVLLASTSETESARVMVMAQLSYALKSTRFTEHEVAALLDAISFTDDEARLGDRQFVFDLRPHADPSQPFDQVARVEALLADPDATLLVDAGELPHSKVAAATTRPDRVLGIRLLNPVGTMPLMELVTGNDTSADTSFKAGAFLTAVLGSHLLQSVDQPLFAANALPIPYVVSAIRIHESRLANTDDIDAAHIPGCTRSLGPLEFADLIGLDTLHDILQRLHAESPEANLTSPPGLVKLVQAGHLGRKSGKGFFRYPTGQDDLEVLTAGALA